jgi:predicted DNA-binding transcriptional regulator AlpA
MQEDVRSKRLMDATLGDLADVLYNMNLSANNNSAGFQSIEPEFIGIAACSLLTGYKPNYLRQLVFKRAIPFYKAKNRKPVRFKRSEILAWMSEKKTLPIADLVDNYLQDKPHPKHKT